MTCFKGELAKAEPKTIRYRMLHVAAHSSTTAPARPPPRRDLAVGQ